MNIQPVSRVDVRIPSVADAAADGAVGPRVRLARVLRLLAPFIGLAVFFLIWQYGVKVFDIKKFVLPRPSDILSSINADKSFYLRNARTTVWEAFLGIFVAFVLAMIGATLMAHSRFIERLQRMPGNAVFDAAAPLPAASAGALGATS